MSEPTVIPVSTPSRSYDVLVGRDLLDRVGSVCRDVVGGAVAAIVSDSNVTPLYAARVARSLEDSGYRTTTITFDAGEQHKRFSTLEAILEKLAAAELSRDDVVVALGGGVTGDMAGLAAALYLRGIDVVQVPTSLLAMVDSSVGGKTAVDLAHGKNLAGIFLQPAAVLVDIDCLSTLSHELFSDSCGEVIKHGVLADPALFERIATRPINEEDFPADELVDIIARNIEIKRDVVNADETERGVRQTLNLGHTIGHAIEAASDYAWGHGASVACGLCCIARAAAAKSWCDPVTAHRIEDVVRSYGLLADTSVDHETLMRFMTHDKKRHGSTFNVIIPRALGHVEVRTLDLDGLSEIVSLGCGTSDRKG